MKFIFLKIKNGYLLVCIQTCLQTSPFSTCQNSIWVCTVSTFIQQCIYKLQNFPSPRCRKIGVVWVQFSQLNSSSPYKSVPQVQGGIKGKLHGNKSKEMGHRLKAQQHGTGTVLKIQECRAYIWNFYIKKGSLYRREKCTSCLLNFSFGLYHILIRLSLIFLHNFWVGQKLDV